MSGHDPRQSSSDRQSLRPLRPRTSEEDARNPPGTPTQNVNTTQFGSVVAGPGTIPQSAAESSSSASAKKGSRQRVACTNCQKRKSKCDGTQPCSRCATSNQECIYESDVGIPRTQALKRKNEVLNEDNDKLRYIVQGLRYGSEQEAAEILRRIRSTKDAEEAVAAINEAALLVKPSWADLPAFSPLEPGQRPPNANPEFLAPSPGGTRQGLTTARPATIGSSTPATDPNRDSSSQSFFRSSPMPSSRQSQASVYTNSTLVASSRPSVRWTPWTPSTTATAAGTTQPQGLAERLNQLCDGFPFLDPSESRQAPYAENAVLYLWHTNVPAHPWTSITDDDDLVSALVTRFFLWEQPWYNYINKAAFLEDMCSVQDVPNNPEAWDREFCSPCLVNSICAIGAMSSRHPGAFKFPGDLKSRGHHFVEEAERLIRAGQELSKPRLTTMQAIWFTMWFRGAAGQRFLSSEFAERFYWMYDQLNLGQEFERPREYDFDPRAKLYWHAVSEVIWGFYCQDALHCIANGGNPRLSRPRIEKTFGRHSRTAMKPADLWWPCPDPQRTENSLVEEMLDYKCDLTDIIRKMLIFVNSIQEKVHSNDLGMDEFWGAYAIYDELCAWKENLPDVLAPGGSLLPHVLLLQANLDIAVITLWRSLQGMTPEPAAFAPSDSARPGHPQAREVLHPRTYVLTHSLNILGIMTQFRARWSYYRHCYSSQCHWLPAFALLFYLRPGEPSSDAFTAAVRGLREIGQKWNVAMWMLLSIKGLAKKFNIELPARSKKYLENLEFEAPKRGPDATDVMIPVTIPAEFRAQDCGLFPFPDSKEVGTYVANLNNVLNQLGDVNLNR